MPVFEAARGGRIDLTLPRTEWKELEEVVDAYAQLRRERQVTNSRLRGLVREREKAIEKDRAVLAQAIRDGSPEAGDQEVERVEKEIAACNRRLEAIERALDDAEADVIAVMDEHRDEWLPEVEEALEEARAAYSEVVEELDAARGKVSAAYALAHWVRWFPDEEKGAISFRVRGSFLARLRATHGDPYTFADVVQALREDAEARRDPGVVSGDPLSAETQARHEERRANQQAGRGYYTDAELARIEENPLAFYSGEGATRVRPPLVMPASDQDDEEGSMK